jgi:L-iditol 2-dehydrogenase
VKYELGKGKLRVQEMPEPKPLFNQVKIKVKAASICSSDMSYWLSESVSYRLNPPVILGHEGSGVVVEVGEGVHHVKPGDRVIAETTIETCLECDACMNGQFNNCTRRKGLGSSANGFFAEYVVALDRSVHKIPDHLSFEAAALLEPMTCAIHGVMEKADVRPYHTVLVSGPGPIGLFAAQAAKICGATVILSGTTRGLPRLKLAESFGIDHTINSNTEDVTEVVNQITKGRGVDVAFECSGAQSAIYACMESLKFGGTYVWLGGMSSNNGELCIEYNKLFGGKELKLIGARSTTPAAWNMALRLVEQKKMHVQELVTHTLPLEEWEKGFGMVMNREAIKVILNPELTIGEKGVQK